MNDPLVALDNNDVAGTTALRRVSGSLQANRQGFLQAMCVARRSRFICHLRQRHATRIGLASLSSNAASC